ncbi:hypothetical protein LOAG_08028 [Loa loa]|uniref:Uncharacterized protein n=1 Tax=Loa loa TaxID=7209 RepID=A0A1S0TW93_LOALO|nr:hypothetical protein LOAG_08028 [Loa loa]EFO20460.1 hypothetical protein LOAG_08028 [Loa loa]
MDSLTGPNEFHLPGFGIRVVFSLRMVVKKLTSPSRCGHTLSDPSFNMWLAWEALRRLFQLPHNSKPHKDIQASSPQQGCHWRFW